MNTTKQNKSPQPSGISTATQGGKHAEPTASKGLDIRSLRIGDKVKDKASGFVFIVTGLFAPEAVQAVPDVEDYEGDVWEFATHELEPYTDNHSPHDDRA